MYYIHVCMYMHVYMFVHNVEYSTLCSTMLYSDLLLSLHWLYHS